MFFSLCGGSSRHFFLFRSVLRSKWCGARVCVLPCAVALVVDRLCSKHKKECKKRAAELYDEKLFKDPPPPDECPICLLLPDIQMRRDNLLSILAVERLYVMVVFMLCR